MDPTTMTFKARRRLGMALFIVAALAFWIIDHALTANLRKPAIVSGLALMAIVVLLTLFNARKKLPFLPLLRASTWTQFHIYAGLVSVAVFFVHVGVKLPTGWLETTLFVLFLAVALSGFAGLALSRMMPPRLTVAGENVMFERIPSMRSTVRREVEEAVVQSVAQTNSTTISEFYEKKLRAYFAGPSFIMNHLIGYRKPVFRLMADVEALDRYLNAEERVVMAQVTDLIRAKNNLDVQLAGQGLLRGWLFVHIPLTYSMIVFAVVHGTLAWMLT
jgi:hypothetical protein